MEHDDVAALRRFGRLLGLLWLTGFLVASVVGVTPAFPGARAVVLGLVVALGAAIWSVTARGTAGRVVLLVAVCAATTAVTPLMVDEGTGGLVGSTLTWLASAASVAALLSFPSLRTGVVAGVVTGTSTLAAAVVVAQRVGLERVEPALPFLNLVLCAIVAVAVRRGSSLTHRMMLQTHRATEDVARTSALLEAERAADRDIHDGALALLSVLAHGSPLDPQAVRDACAAEVARARTTPTAPGDPSAAREGASSPQDPFDRLEASARLEAKALGIEVRCHRRAADIHLAPEVRAALSDALRECLRNTARHSGVAVVDVACTVVGSELGVAVIDTGRGFDVAAACASRLGLRESVVARVQSVGGHADVWSAPGRGTTVSLRVPLRRAATVTSPC